MLHTDNQGDSVNFIFRGDELLLSESSIDFPDADVCVGIGLGADALQSVGPSNGSSHYTCQVARDIEAPSGFAFRKLRAVLTELGEYGSLAGRAFQVSEWVRTHRYCGVCATPMHKSEKELCFHCSNCGFSAYPRISPAMMVLIKRDDQILLARHATYATARYTALAGFVEAGESIEEAIHREVFEEVGLQVKDLRYFGSQSWPFPHSLMIAYTAEYAGGELRLQQDEIADAHWFGPGDALPDIPMLESIAGRLVRANLPSNVAVGSNSATG
ncbi:MAG: NAD(+) diphosphatase [Burkholderiaceae bacterium]|nr:NAD(+) diphosphatase [Burkholderiaceae bacterium]